MKTITDLFDEAWKKKEQRGWELVYIMVDLHGVVLPPNYHKHNDLQFISPHAEECLRYLTEQEDVCLILWSSSHVEEILNVRQWLAHRRVFFSFVNENPLEKNTEYADFTKKPYFSIVLDDKAGFEPDDWEDVEVWMTRREMFKMK